MLLAAMDDTELQLALREATSELQGLRREYRQALASLDQAESRIITARIGQVEAELDLVRYRLQQVSLVSNVDGYVIEGDLSQSLGVPVAKGDREARPRAVPPRAGGVGA